jgi:hypothetical protein
VSLASLVSLNALEEFKICRKARVRAHGSKQNRRTVTGLQHALRKRSAVERIRLVAQQMPLRGDSAKYAQKQRHWSVLARENLDDSVVDNVAAAGKPNRFVHESAHDWVEDFI